MTELFSGVGPLSSRVVFARTNQRLNKTKIGGGTSLPEAPAEFRLADKLIERDSDAFLFAPYDCTAARVTIGNHGQREFVRDLLICSDIKRGAKSRNATNSANSFRAAEAD